MKPKLYQSLPGRGRRGLFLSFAVSSSWCSLWLGPDHLLSVESRNYQEEYKRFYFRDIQAVIMRRTQRASATNVFFLIMLVLFASLMIVAGPNGRIVTGILAGTTLLILTINLLRGPSCVCHLMTAVHTEELPSLNRLKTAREVVARLRPFIEGAQGAVTPELLQARDRAPPIEAAEPFPPTRTPPTDQTAADPHRVIHDASRSRLVALRGNVSQRVLHRHRQHDTQHRADGTNDLGFDPANRHGLTGRSAASRNELTRQYSVVWCNRL